MAGQDDSAKVIDEVKIPSMRLYSFLVSSYSIGNWKIVETGQPWRKAMSSLLRPMETTQTTTIVMCNRGEEEPERLMLLLAHSLESC